MHTKETEKAVLRCSGLGLELETIDQVTPRSVAASLIDITSKSKRFAITFTSGEARPSSVTEQGRAAAVGSRPPRVAYLGRYPGSPSAGDSGGLHGKTNISILQSQYITFCEKILHGVDSFGSAMSNDPAVEAAAHLIERTSRHLWLNNVPPRGSAPNKARRSAARFFAGATMSERYRCSSAAEKGGAE